MIQSSSVWKNASCGPEHPFNWKDVPEMSPPHAYSAGTELFRQGGTSQSVYFLDKGLIKTDYTDSGGHRLIISLLGTPGSMVGASCAIMESHSVTATVLTNSYMRSLPTRVFREMLRAEPRASWHVHQTHCSTLTQQVTQRLQQGGISARQRFEQFLWQMSRLPEITTVLPDKRLLLHLPLKYCDIAQLLVVSGEHLCRIVKGMEREGLVRRSKGEIILSRPNDLWQDSTSISSQWIQAA